MANALVNVDMGLTQLTIALLMLSVSLCGVLLAALLRKYNLNSYSQKSFLSLASGLSLGLWIFNWVHLFFKSLNNEEIRFSVKNESAAAGINCLFVGFLSSTVAYLLFLKDSDNAIHSKKEQSCLTVEQKNGNDQCGKESRMDGVAQAFLYSNWEFAAYNAALTLLNIFAGVEIGMDKHPRRIPRALVYALGYKWVELFIFLFFLKDSDKHHSLLWKLPAAASVIAHPLGTVMAPFLYHTLSKNTQIRLISFSIGVLLFATIRILNHTFNSAYKPGNVLPAFYSGMAYSIVLTFFHSCIQLNKNT